KKPQLRLAFHLDKLRLANSPPINGTIVARPATENAAPPAAPAGGGIEEIDERQDRKAGNQDHKPLLMAPNVSKHKSTCRKIQKFRGAPYTHGPGRVKRKTSAQARGGDTPTIAEVSCSLSLRGTSGERGSFHRIVALF